MIMKLFAVTVIGGLVAFAVLMAIEHSVLLAAIPAVAAFGILALHNT